MNDQPRGRHLIAADRGFATGRGFVARAFAGGFHKLLALSVAVTLGQGSVLAHAAQGNSLIVSDWPDGLNMLPCDLTGPCEMFSRRVRITHVKTLAGPSAPRAIVFGTGEPAYSRRGSRLLAIVWRDRDEWRVRLFHSLESVWNGCVDASLLSEYAIPVPPQAHRNNNQICFPTASFKHRS